MKAPNEGNPIVVGGNRRMETHGESKRDRQEDQVCQDEFIKFLIGGSVIDHGALYSIWQL